MSKYNIGFLFLVPLLLILVWFRGGNILATAEGGLLFNNLQNHAQIAKYSWADPALGNSTGMVTASYPTYELLSILEKNQVPGFVIQAVIFYFLFVTAGFGILFFSKLLFPDLPDKYLLVVIAFYWFNPFAMVNIWHRFLYNFMVFYSFFPIVTYFYLKGIINKKIGYSVIVAVLSGVFSYSLTSTPFNFLIWMVFFLVSFFYLQDVETLRKRLWIVWYFATTLLLYSIINAWWISQLLSFVKSSSYETVTNSFFSQEGNFGTLQILSAKLGWFTDTIRLYHSDFFSQAPYGWVGTYTTLPLTLFSFVFPLIGLSTLISKKEKSVLMLLVLFGIGIFLVKGNNPPFGDLFEFVFFNFPFFQVFRNPFEKFGFLLPISLSPLVGYGLFVLLRKMTFEKFFFGLSLFGILLFYGFPFFSGAVFNIDKEISFHNDYEVKVPDEYNEIDNFLKQDNSFFRFMVMPLGGEGIKQDWEKGYNGVEASSTLFTKPSLSFNTTIPYFYEITKTIQQQFFSNPRFLEIANRLGIKYFLVRNDIDFISRGMLNPQMITDRLKQYDLEGKVDLKKTSGNLTLWGNNEFQDQFSFISNTYISSNNPTDIFDLTLSESSSTAILIDEKSAGKLDLDPVLAINNPSRVYFFKDILKNGFLRDQTIFPFISISPVSIQYPLLIVKEKIEINVIPLSEKKLTKELFYLGKRLSEIHYLNEGKDSFYKEQVLKEYIEQWTKYKSDYLNLSGQSELSFWNDYGRKIINHQLTFMTEISKKASGSYKSQLEELTTDVSNFVDASGILPHFELLDTIDFPIKDRSVLQYQINQDGKYQIVVFSPYELPKNADRNITVQIDNLLNQINVTKLENNQYSLGEFSFTKGVHEIGLNHLFIPAVVGDAIFKSEKMKIPILNFNPYDNYQITYEIPKQFKNVIKVNLKYYSDDKLIGNAEYYRSDRYNNQNLNVQIDFYNIPFSSRAEVEIEFVNGLVSKQEIKNLQINQIVSFTPKLIMVKAEKKALFKPVSVLKINPTYYKLDIPVIDQEVIVVLSQLFNSGWVLQDKDGNEFSKHLLVNGYANGWVLPKGDKRTLYAVYKPELLLDKAKKISLVGFVLGVLGGGVLLWRKKL